MILAALVSALLVAVFVWQDGMQNSNDGNRYTSGKAQPYPFHRRWCGWPRKVLVPLSVVSLVALGTLMGTWQRAAMLISLPGAWVIATRPTIVDGPAMLLSYGASMVFPHNPWVALGMSCVSGFIHERAPVFAALYAWSPLLLLGLVGSGWWRKPAPPDDDLLVGRGFIESLWSHKPYIDWLHYVVPVWALRGVGAIAVYSGTSLSAWASLAVAMVSRLVGTDGARYLFWAAPALVRDLPDVAPWMVAAHVVSFRRVV